jgi:hypothetical protein
VGSVRPRRTARGITRRSRNLYLGEGCSSRDVTALRPGIKDETLRSVAGRGHALKHHLEHWRTSRSSWRELVAATKELIPSSVTFATSGSASRLLCAVAKSTCDPRCYDLGVGSSDTLSWSAAETRGEALRPPVPLVRKVESDADLAVTARISLIGSPSWLDLAP